MSAGETNPLIEEAFNDRIIRYSKQTLNYECLLCKKSMTGDAPLAQHLESKKHEEAAFRYAINHVSSCPESLKKFFTPEIKRAVEDGTIEVSKSPGGIYGIYCKACNKDVNGYAPLTQHLVGADHRKQLQGVQVRIPSFVTGASNGRLEEARSVTSPLLAPGSESFVKFPPRITPTCTSAISSTQTTPIPTLTFRNDQRHVPNGTSLLEPSYPRLPEPAGLYRSQSSHREMSPIRFPTPLSPIQSSVSLSTSATNSFPKRSESREVTPSSPLPRHSLPLINSGALHLDPISLVLQAVNDDVLVFNSETMKYTCRVCRLFFSTQQQTEDHLKHKIHREASARIVVPQLGRGPPSLLELLPRNIIEAAAASTITVTEGNAFKCVVCGTSSTGVIPLKQHLESREHLKKNGNSAGQPAFPHLSNAYTRSTESSSVREPPGHLHTGNDVDVNALTVAFERGLVFCVDNNSSVYKCEVCDVTLNSLRNLDQHLNGAKHKKQFQKNSLLPGGQPCLTSSQSSEDPNVHQERAMYKDNRMR